ncbi:MAG TPA: precorrin-8X methylmutase [Methanothrix sp.]|jgi:precorrin-8X/cobalt-precorrin-8 methylmutase|nr:precorrin-8X methylmutase [Methanothrix sp.]HUM80879.1 precorrin-8X methylmutase [Methanothrix sp.]
MSKGIMEGYTDIGAVTPEAMEISKKSRRLISQMVGDRDLQDRIKQRCVIATGDPSLADIIRFHNHPEQAGLQALEEHAPIFVDIKMVEAGVLKTGHESPIHPIIGQGDDIAERLGVTRTSAGIMALQERLAGSIVVIGNAPSALLTLCRLIEEEKALPRMVIGVPVGFVNAAESKERLRGLEVPSITTEGTRGGTPIAVAAINEIINTYARAKI